MKVKWRCNCGEEGESEVGLWMRCGNPDCTKKNAFQILDIPDFRSKGKSFHTRLSRLEEKVKKLSKNRRKK